MFLLVRYIFILVQLKLTRRPKNFGKMCTTWLQSLHFQCGSMFVTKSMEVTPLSRARVSDSILNKL